jgi:hypothetical protein
MEGGISRLGGCIGLQIQDPHAKISERSRIDADFHINLKIHIQGNFQDFA